MMSEAIVHKITSIEHAVKRIEEVYRTFPQFENSLTNERRFIV